MNMAAAGRPSLSLSVAAQTRPQVRGGEIVHCSVMKQPLYVNSVALSERF